MHATPVHNPSPAVNASRAKPFAPEYRLALSALNKLHVSPTARLTYLTALLMSIHTTDSVDL